MITRMNSGDLAKDVTEAENHLQMHNERKVSVIWTEKFSARVFLSCYILFVSANIYYVAITFLNLYFKVTAYFMNIFL